MSGSKLRVCCVRVFSGGKARYWVGPTEDSDWKGKQLYFPRKTVFDRLGLRVLGKTGSGEPRFLGLSKRYPGRLIFIGTQNIPPDLLGKFAQELETLTKLSKKKKRRKDR